jgi:hypothetical protein
MAAGGKRKKTKKAGKAKRAALVKGKTKKTKKAKKVAAPRKAKSRPKKAAKCATKKSSKRKARAGGKAKAPIPTIQDIAPSGEPEFVSSTPLLKL